MLTVILLEPAAVHRYHTVLLGKKTHHGEMLLQHLKTATSKLTVSDEEGFTVHLEIGVLCYDAAVGYLLVETLRQSRFPPIGDPEKRCHCCV